MTHFIGAVVVPNEVEFITNTMPTKYPDLYGAKAKEWIAGSALNDYLNKALHPFDENVEVKRWVSKEDTIADKRKEIQEYAEGTYAEFLELGEAGYRAAHPHAQEAHIEYVRDTFPTHLAWTDEEVYLDAIKWEEPQDLRDDGAVQHHYNPKSEWDWWTIGGRWEDLYRERQGEKIPEFMSSIQEHLAAKADPLEAAKLAAVEAEIEVAKQQLDAKLINYDAYEKIREKLIECKAYTPWWFPSQIIVPVKRMANGDEEQVFEEDGSPVLIEDFDWIKQYKMGWWGMHGDGPDDASWAEQLLQILTAQDRDSRLVFIDFHI